jgi:hypothetical protein
MKHFLQQMCGLRASAILALAGVLMLAGCSLPPITKTFSVAENQTLGALSVSLPLLDIPLIAYATPNLPDRGDLQAVVEQSIGSWLARFVSVDSAELSSIFVDVSDDSPGSFSSITKVKLRLYLLDAGNIQLQTIPIGSAQRLEGFGKKIDIAVNPPVDLVGLLSANADYAAVSIQASGKSPAEDVVFSVSATVKIRARVHL